MAWRVAQCGQQARVGVTHWLGYSLNVVTKNLAMALSTALSETLWYHWMNICTYVAETRCDELVISHRPFHLFHVQTLFTRFGCLLLRV